MARHHGTLALSRAVYAEYDEVLHRPRFEHLISRGRVQEMLDILIVAALWVEPQVGITDCRDAKDNAYLELALEAGAECIISGDQDLLVLHPWRGIEIVTPNEFASVDRARARIAASLEDTIDEIYGPLPEGETRSLIREQMRLSYKLTMLPEGGKPD